MFACVQKPDEHLRDFIRTFSKIRNTIPDTSGCKDKQTTEKLATKNPKTVAELYKILNATAKAADAQA